MTRWMVAALLTLSVPALAQTEAAQRSKQREAPQRVTELTFGEGDLIDAEAEGPDHELIDTLPRLQHSSLIRVRADFDAEVMRSAAQL
ncbi:hypothetical protein [Hyalangium gracile]|uniref:hypothetical protein n=1 Tax=Hyalangium gracile TaxID=394092 RepID=UPI001CCEF31C|nr:hypothetical protein [Hyalangium gracile]